MDADQERKKILRQVADGTLDPTDAAERLAALDRDAETGSGGSGEGDEEYVEKVVRVRRTGDTGPVRSIRVGGSFRSVEIIGDDSVKEAVAEGPHRARQEGDVLVIDGAMLDDEDGFVFSRGDRSHRRVRINVSSSSNSRPRPLVVRMNPDLDLEARVEAGPLSIDEVHGKIRARVAAGPLRIQGFRSPVDLRVAAGTVKARGRIDRGESRIECEAGKVHLHLERGSSVRVRASASLGKVLVGGRAQGSARAAAKAGARAKAAGRAQAQAAADGGVRAKAGARAEARRVRGFGEDGFDLSNLHATLSGMFADSEEIIIGGGRGDMEVIVAMGAADITADDDPRHDDDDEDGVDFDARDFDVEL